MNSPKLTEWFGPDVKPTIPGVYETSSFDYYGSRFQHWNGIWWGFYKPNVKEAHSRRKEKSCEQYVKWRGLASDPSKESNK